MTVVVAEAALDGGVPGRAKPMLSSIVFCCCCGRRKDLPNQINYIIRESRIILSSSTTYPLPQSMPSLPRFNYDYPVDNKLRGKEEEEEEAEALWNFDIR